MADESNPINLKSVKKVVEDYTVELTQKDDLKPGQVLPFDEKAFEATQNLVAVKTSQADEIRQKIKEVNESIKNVSINDPQLAEAEEKANETKVAVKKRKQEINESPEVRSLQARLKEFKEDLKDIEDTLSTQLLNLYQITGVKEFETVSGEIREFDIKAKVKGKGKKAE